MLKQEKALFEGQIKKLKEQSDIVSKQLASMGTQVDALLAAIHGTPPAKPIKEEAKNIKTPSHTLDDVREAYLRTAKTCGKDAAIGVIKDIAGDVPNITHVPKEAFADIIVALQYYAKKEAA